MDDLVAWTIPASHARKRLWIALPLILVMLVSLPFTEDRGVRLFGVALFVVLMGGVLIHVVTARDKHYRLTPDGFVRTIGDGPPKEFRWSDHVGWQTHAEVSSRAARPAIREATLTLGQGYVLRTPSFWRSDTDLPTMPAVTARVHEAMSRALPHATGLRVKAPSLLLVAGGLLLAYVLLVAFTR